MKPSNFITWTVKLYFVIITFLPEYAKSEVPKPCAEVPQGALTGHLEIFLNFKGHTVTPVGRHVNYQPEAG